MNGERPTGIETAAPAEPSLGVLARHVVVAPAVLGALLAVDFGFLVLHRLWQGSDPETGAGRFGDDRYSLYADGGFAELWGYGQALAAALLLVLLFRRWHQPVHAAWAALFVVIAVDDAAQVHERVGEWLATSLDLPELIGLRAQDAGELAVWAALAAGLVAMIVVTHRRSDPRARTHVRPLGLAVGFLVAAGVGLDMLAIIVKEGTRTYRLVSTAEDLGELVALSVAVAVAARLLQRAREGVAIPRTGWFTCNP